MRTQLRITYAGHSYLKIELGTDYATYYLRKFIEEKRLLIQDISIEKSDDSVIDIHGTCHEDKENAVLGHFSIAFKVVTDHDVENLNCLEEFLLGRLGEL